MKKVITIIGMIILYLLLVTNVGNAARYPLKDYGTEMTNNEFNNVAVSLNLSDRKVSASITNLGIMNNGNQFVNAALNVEYAVRYKKAITIGSNKYDLRVCVTPKQIKNACQLSFAADNSLWVKPINSKVEITYEITEPDAFSPITGHYFGYGLRDPDGGDYLFDPAGYDIYYINATMNAGIGPLDEYYNVFTDSANMGISRFNAYHTDYNEAKIIIGSGGTARFTFVVDTTKDLVGATVGSGTEDYVNLPILTYKPKEYDISYVLNGGTQGTYHPNHTVYENVIRISNPTRTGYNFAGWTMTNGNASTAKYGSTSSNVTTAWSSPTTNKVKYEYFKNLTNIDGRTVTLTANWTPITYTVEYYQGHNSTSAGTTVLGESEHTYGVAKNLSKHSSFAAPTLSKPNSTWKFAGWSKTEKGLTIDYTDEQSVINLTTTQDGIIKLYAVFKRDITFISGVNKETTETAEQKYNPYKTTGYITSVTVPTLTVISEWTALGYRSNATAAAATVTAGSNITPAYNATSTTYYGVYSKEYTSNFYSGVNKATNNPITGTAYYNTNTATVPTTVKITFPSAENSTNITNWTEVGWRNDITAGTKEYDYGQENISVGIGEKNFYSVYSREITITYNGNGSTGGSTTNTTKTVYLNTNSTTTSSQAVTLATNGYTKTGYTAKTPVWNTKADGSGTSLAAGASYNPSLAYNATTFGKTLYAQWQANTATITIKKDNSNWSSSGINVVLYQNNSAKYTYANATKEGATVSWTAVKAGTYDVYASKNNGALTTLVDTGINVTITNTGTATIDYYTLTLNKGVGISAVSGAGTYLKNQVANIDATVTNGYKWQGWSVVSGNTPE